ncbi:hypothetical protein GCM10023194_03630 [Planotetraspora phitsanulokensis]|uniref:Uncharacterized protein n=1 Tax=Planotetraspora phitsanulokensis TaxID=575192 RepID=A0A8J3UA27_9ACTN|nr:hypothetical protein Pph01_57840 [Planotetraspora phitsanulokensis]
MSSSAAPRLSGTRGASWTDERLTWGSSPTRCKGVCPVPKAGVVISGSIKGALSPSRVLYAAGLTHRQVTHGRLEWFTGLSRLIEAPRNVPNFGDMATVRNLSLVSGDFPQPSCAVLSEVRIALRPPAAPHPSAWARRIQVTARGTPGLEAPTTL